MRIIVGVPECTELIGSKRSAAATESAGGKFVASQKRTCDWIPERDGSGVSVFAIPLVQFDGDVLIRRLAHTSRHHRGSAQRRGDPISHQFSRFRLALSSIWM